VAVAFIYLQSFMFSYDEADVLNVLLDSHDLIERIPDM